MKLSRCNKTLIERPRTPVKEKLMKLDDDQDS